MNTHPSKKILKHEEDHCGTLLTIACGTLLVIACGTFLTIACGVFLTIA